MSQLPVPLNMFTEEQRALAEPGAADHRVGLPVANPTQPFWFTAPNVTPAPREGSDTQLPAHADICIIGSGISGVSVAYHLAKLLASEPEDPLSRPLKAIILDAREFCTPGPPCTRDTFV